jgi:hypothetical protein
MPTCFPRDTVSNRALSRRVKISETIGSVIVVPGVGTASPDTWFEGKGQTWDHFLPDDVLPSPTVYYFHHGLGPDIDSRLWSNLLDRGLGLLEDLLVLLNARDEVCQNLFSNSRICEALIPN